MENAMALNYMDTVTNLIFLFVAMLPVYVLPLDMVLTQAPIKRAPLLKVAINGKLKIVTLRNPFTAKWLVTFTMPYKPKLITIVDKGPNTALTIGYLPGSRPPFTRLVPRLALRYSLILLALVGLTACFPSQGGTDTDKVSTVYVDASYEGRKSCWFPIQASPQRDSLYVEGRKYVVSDRSRYRVANLDEATIDGLMERDIVLNDWGYYRDTKGDSVIVLNRCDFASPRETATPEKACIEAYPVVTDTIIKGLEEWPLKVAFDFENTRCRWDEDYNDVVCKGRYSDTTWVIDTYCPATLKARSAMGGE
jgi:hypothetical protein